MNQALLPVRRRILVLAGICLLLAAALAHRFYVVQIERHDELLNKATKTYTAKTERKHPRGKILDFTGEVFAGNLPKIFVCCSPYSVVDEPFNHLEKSLKAGVREKLPVLRDTRRRKVAGILAQCFGGLSEAEYYAELAPWEEKEDRDGKKRRLKRHYLVIEKAADPETVKNFKAAMESADLHLGGFVFRDTYTRNYPKGRMLANIIGVASITNEGTAELSGLEKSHGVLLRPVDGKGSFQRSGDGRILAYGKRQENAGHNGCDIYLTIREPIQAILESELDTAARETGAKRIYALIVDPRSGNILAMGQRPNFDPADPKNYQGDGFSNAIASNAYEPGSVMKPFFIAKALDENIITPDSLIDCGEYKDWYYAGRKLSDPRGYGKMTPGGVLKKSSNIGTVKVALMMGDQLVWDTLKDFQFGKKSALKFAGESGGILPKFPFRGKVTITRVPIGYAEQVTALQLARGYSTIANRGMMPQLRLVDRVFDPVSGKMTKEPYWEKVRVLKHKETFDALVDMLISVTAADGTGKRARIPGYDVAGKTGTSQMVVNGIPSKEWYRASFCGFVPARDPELLMVVTVEGLHVSKPYGGGAVAAPVFQRTMSRVLKFLNVTPDRPEELVAEKNNKKK